VTVRVQSQHWSAAGVVELVDTQDLGSCAFGCEGSSPSFGTLHLQMEVTFELVDVARGSHVVLSNGNCAVALVIDINNKC
jgi:hypothetical protein